MGPNFVALGQWFLTGVTLPLRGLLSMLEAFLIITTGKAIGIEWVDTTDASNRSTMHQTAPTTDSSSP